MEQPGRARRGRRVLLRILIALALFLTVLEVGLRVSGMDRSILTGALYYQGADPAVHRPSADPALRYELSPGSTGSDTGPYGPYEVHVSSLGARGPERDAAKAPGVFRVLVFGSSPIFGARVGDAETTPAALEQALNAGAGAGIRFEVWNFGRSAGTFDENVYVARRRSAQLDPDLVLLQLYNVNGRHAFPPPYPGIGPDFYWSLLAADRALLLENLPAPFWLPDDLHVAGLHHVATYRALVGLLNAQDPSSTWNPPGRGPNCGELDALRRELSTRGRALALFAFPVDPSGGRAPRGCRGEPPLPLLSLDAPGREPEFYREHPPARIHREHGQRLAALLREAGLVPQVP